MRDTFSLVANQKQRTYKPETHGTAIWPQIAEMSAARKQGRLVGVGLSEKCGVNNVPIRVRRLYQGPFFIFFLFRGLSLRIGIPISTVQPHSSFRWAAHRHANMSLTFDQPLCANKLVWSLRFLVNNTAGSLQTSACTAVPPAGVRI